jgi:hypothetical protein
MRESHSSRHLYGPHGAPELSNVRLTGGNTLIDLAYATANGSGDYANGKLRMATRHNWISGVDNQVAETYTHGGVGRLDPPGSGGGKQQILGSRP